MCIAGRQAVHATDPLRLILVTSSAPLRLILVTSSAGSCNRCTVAGQSVRGFSLPLHHFIFH